MAKARKASAILQDDDAVNPEGPHLNASKPMEDDKKRKKKKKAAADEQGADKKLSNLDASIVAETEEAPSREHRKKRKRDVEDNALDGDHVPVKKSKKRQTQVDDLQEQPLAPEVDSSSKPKKKRKTKGQEVDTSVVTTEEGRPLAGEAIEKKKRKKKSMGGELLPDPIKDESLTEQARNSLVYTLSFLVCSMGQSSQWKFNKARQNWLVRNALDENAIPEVYVDGVLRYLATIKGGVRLNLVQVCKMVLDGSAPAAALAGEPDPQPADDPTGADSSAGKRLSKERAERLVALLEAS